MEERKNPQRNTKVVIRPSPRVLKIVVALLIVFSTLTLVGLGWVRAGIQKETEDKRQEAVELEQENADLSEKIGATGSIQSALDIAQDELGLADPDTVIINPNSD